MDVLGSRYLGFTLSYDLTWRQGRRDRTASRGVCAECGKHREHVYIRFDGTLYCRYCIHYDLAHARPLDEQTAPMNPVETPWERVRSAGGRDDFADRLAFWQAQVA